MYVAYSSADDEGSDSLLKVTLRLVPHENCNASFFDGGSSVELALGIVNDWQICAEEVGKDTCQVILYTFVIPRKFSFPSE